MASTADIDSSLTAIETPKLQTRALRRALDDAAYRLYVAAHEWDLIDPILIRDRNDLKSEPKWRDQIKPYHHQITNLVTFCRRLPVTLLADDVGLGKTISAGLIASELISRNRISKILVVCPKLLIPQWKEELESKFGIPGIGATGNDLLKAKIPDGGGAVITTYHSARMYLSSLSQSGFEMLILDEAHKLRNLYGTSQAPQVAQKFKQALAERMFKYVLMLTATPIQNRLWDIYSLVDLLAVARGHQNPFGSDGVFARTFIADDRTQARRLEPRMREAFRAVVYGYMSRIRRADANLHFPERIVQLHRVDPLPEEHELIETIAGPIQALNRLAQISILQALISSPHALLAQLRKMADNGTVSRVLLNSVEEIVSRIHSTAKLQGLGTLVDKLRAEQPQRWRMVIFTTRRETQTTIEAFLQQRGIRCGLINGESGARNQQTISKFKKPIPEINAIVSTEAGSEGVNLQSANVLVNFDLPWNPMIVEQRIGRIQRLASEHASVCIFNMILRGTFEEYIVGRLMEKLQMAAHAIGDIEALLEAAGMDDHNEEHLAFEELIRRLVIASLAGKNVEESTRLAEKSIAAAAVELENQEKNIDALLGAMDEPSNEIPYPHLPEVVRSMGLQEFVLAAMSSLGTPLSPESEGVYFSEREGKIDRLCFDEAHSSNAVLYRPGTVAFSRLVSRIAATGLHNVKDTEDKARANAEKLGKEWVEGFEGSFRSAEIRDVERCFGGTATVKIRATVGHDSYERLINVRIEFGEVRIPAGITGASPITDPLKSPEAVGLSSAFVLKKAMQDKGINEFCRFYIERRKQELSASGGDLRKRKKIEDDFTPRLEASLVGLEGDVRRQITLATAFELGGAGPEYWSSVEVIPSENRISKSPDLLPCSHSERIAPRDCFARCEVSGSLVLKHLLVKSEVSDRVALPEFIGTCSVTGKRVLTDELERSAVTQHMVLKSILKTSELSARRAEPEFFGTCEFTGVQGLQDELATSKVSGKKFRKDKEQRSVVSGKTGYVDEFILCSETRQPLLVEEAETCKVSNKLVIPGLLVRCEVTGEKVLPSFVERSAATGKTAQKIFFVSSSISGARLLPDEGVKSALGKYCLQSESKLCLWSGRRCHPEDLRICQLTHVTAHFEFMNTNGHIRLEPLLDLLNGVRTTTDRQDLWPSIAAMASRSVDARSEVEAAALSPNGEYLAVCLQAKNWLGLRTRQSGLICDIRDLERVGRAVLGKRGDNGWILQVTI